MKKFRKISLIAAVAGVAAIGAYNMPLRAANPLIDQDVFVNVAENTINGVVSVKSFATPRQSFSNGGGFFDDPFFEYFFGGPSSRQRPQQQAEPEKQRQIGLGSGVIISEDGYIVTNNHVIADAERLEVTLNDNQNFNAKVIGTDPTTDLALIKIDADNLHVIPMGKSEDLRVGEWVVAVGNPFGFTSTVTTGVVSAKGRNISSFSNSPSHGIESYIQTDAALNAGNSGGALVNLNGELVGINTAIYSQTGNYSGCSFAIPTSIVNKVINDIMTYGAVQRAVLGIRFKEVTPELVKEKDIKGTNTGIYVASVEDRSAAKEAGIEEGDIIIAINNTPTGNTAQLQEAISMCSPGDTVEIIYVRDGKKATKKVTLRNGQGNTNVVKAGNVTDLGCMFARVPEDTAKQLGISHGVQVRDLTDGPIKDANIRDGFIILTINDTKINKAEDVEKVYNNIMKNDNADKVLFIKGIYPTGKSAYYAVPLAE